MKPTKETSALSLIGYFDRVRIINLARRDDRRRETAEEFSLYGFKLGNEHCGFFNAIAPDDAAGFPNRGVRGCFLSHLGILKEASNDRMRHVLVLEDDITFSRNILSFGTVAVEGLADLDWDIAYLGHALGNAPGKPCWRQIERPMLLAHCYAVHGRTLPRLVDFLEHVLQRPPGHPEGGPMHYDGALNTFITQNPDVKAYYFSKNLGYQRPSRTDLHRVSVLDSNTLLQPFAKLFRATKRLGLRMFS